MRSTAHKVKIEDLVNGEYVHSPEGEPNHLVTPWNQEVLRVNLVATVVDDFIRDDGGYATLTLDDGTGTIRAKGWSEGAEELEKFEVGDLVTVVGKVREYEGEIHLVPEVIREMENPNWELVQELEILENRRKMLKEGVRPKFEKESEKGPQTLEISQPSEQESEEIGIVEELGESSGSEEEPEVSEDLKDNLLLALDKLEGEDGATLEDLSAEVDRSYSETEEALGVLLNEDKVYEPVAGRFKRLG
ncbi:hypothetical protein AKJ65_02460 [candidate division MSBL1 archaeon SCGC-AAA259E19]|uniref:OB domain-containing protein n=1 Tax=candidate division MSBL1 archaeon SCGC-AAA259E19 TaxID=1698264 RepID=A0A133ULR1_9EURY|nr:hypothetical protein AKJ65_02460 [candidate division MSBL1 archaeon SCGC-AAA259E19]